MGRCDFSARYVDQQGRITDELIFCQKGLSAARKAAERFDVKGHALLDVTPVVDGWRPGTAISEWKAPQ